MYISKKELLKIARDNKLRGLVDYTKPQHFVRLKENKCQTQVNYFLQVISYRFPLAHHVRD